VDEEGETKLTVSSQALRLSFLFIFKFDIFQKDAVLIPVNHGNVHWTLAAINFRKKRVESYDSMGGYRSNVYKVRSFSYLTYRIGVLDLSAWQTLRYYLQEEHMDKKKRPFDFTGWKDHFDEVRLNTEPEELQLILMFIGYTAAGKRIRLWCFHLSVYGVIVPRGG
jgi:Ulp1 protease family, C-terminal catalytic domain